MDNSWTHLIEAPTSEMHRLARDLSLPVPQREYAQVVSAFLKGDGEELAKLCDQVTVPEVRELALLRLSIRRRTVSAEGLKVIAEIRLAQPFAAEKLFCLGMAWEILGDDPMSTSCFALASAAYSSEGYPRKALRALYNSIVADSRAQPHKNFIADYQSVIEQSRALNEVSFEGMALAMLSREYQVVGLLDKALGMVQRSVECLEPERGTIHYFHSLLHMSHVLIDLDRLDEAKALLRECELASFPSIQAAHALLNVSLDPGAVWNRGLEADLLPTWKNRLTLLSTHNLSPGRIGREGSSSTTPLEQNLLRLAYNGPIEKWDLIARLYPDGGDSLQLENRFKNLLARVRGKHPDLLHCYDGRYSLRKLPARALDNP